MLVSVLICVYSLSYILLTLLNRSREHGHGGSTYRKSILPFLKPARGTRASQVKTIINCLCKYDVLFTAKGAVYNRC